MAKRTKQPEGCIGISEKCVFAWKSLSSRYRKRGFCFSNCIFIGTLLELNKLAFERILQEELSVKVVLTVFSLRKNKPTHSFLSGPHVFPCCFSPLGE